MIIDAVDVQYNHQICKSGRSEAALKARGSKTAHFERVRERVTGWVKEWCGGSGRERESAQAGDPAFSAL